MSIIARIFDLFGIASENNNVLTGAEAIVTDYQERQNMTSDGKETTAFLIRAERIVEEGEFHDNAVAQLWFDLGKYGEYPVTLDLPEGPGQKNELEDFMDDLNQTVEDLRWMVEEGVEFQFKRIDGEWVIDWSEIGSF